MNNLIRALNNYSFPRAQSIHRYTHVAETHSIYESSITHGAPLSQYHEFSKTNYFYFTHLFCVKNKLRRHQSACIRQQRRCSASEWACDGNVAITGTSIDAATKESKVILIYRVENLLYHCTTMHDHDLSCRVANP
jgi:hypothetical protein